MTWAQVHPDEPPEVSPETLQADWLAEGLETCECGTEWLFDVREQTETELGSIIRYCPRCQLDENLDEFWRGEELRADSTPRCESDL